MSDKPTIRFATAQDVPTILKFIKELAEYENALDEVEATEESLLETLSFPDPSDPTLPPSHNVTSRGGPVYTFLIIPPPKADGGVGADTGEGRRRRGKAEPEPVGMALFFYNYSTWRSAPGVYLEDLYVQPSHRGERYGLALLQRLAVEVRRIGGRRLELSVLTWNEPTIKFYKGIGAQAMTDWTKMMIEGEETLSKLAGEGL